MQRALSLFAAANAPTPQRTSETNASVDDTPRSEAESEPSMVMDSPYATSTTTRVIDLTQSESASDDEPLDEEDDEALARAIEMSLVEEASRQQTAATQPAPQSDRATLMQQQQRAFEAALEQDRAASNAATQPAEVEQATEEQAMEAKAETETKVDGDAESNDVEANIDAATSVPREPSSDEEGVLTVRFRLPDGGAVTRRFASDVTVAQVRAFVHHEAGVRGAFAIKMPFSSASFDDRAATLAALIGGGKNVTLIVADD